MTRTLIVESGQKPKEEHFKEVEKAQKSPIVFDEDCQELSPAMMKTFKSAVVQRNLKKNSFKFVFILACNEPSAVLARA